MGIYKGLETRFENFRKRVANCSTCFDALQFRGEILGPGFSLDQNEHRISILQVGRMVRLAQLAGLIGCHQPLQKAEFEDRTLFNARR
jgi:hypothetical protein